MAKRSGKKGKSKSKAQVRIDAGKKPKK